MRLLVSVTGTLDSDRRVVGTTERESTGLGVWIHVF